MWAVYCGGGAVGAYCGGGAVVGGVVSLSGDTEGGASSSSLAAVMVTRRIVKGESGGVPGIAAVATCHAEVRAPPRFVMSCCRVFGGTPTSLKSWIAHCTSGAARVCAAEVVCGGAGAGVDGGGAGGARGAGVRGGGAVGACCGGGAVGACGVVDACCGCGSGA